MTKAKGRPEKGARAITVDGRDYFWRVTAGGLSGQVQIWRVTGDETFERAYSASGHEVKAKSNGGRRDMVTPFEVANFIRVSEGREAWKKPAVMWEEYSDEERQQVMFSRFSQWMAEQRKTIVPHRQDSALSAVIDIFGKLGTFRLHDEQREKRYRAKGLYILSSDPTGSSFCIEFTDSFRHNGTGIHLEVTIRARRLPDSEDFAISMKIGDHSDTPDGYWEQITEGRLKRFDWHSTPRSYKDVVRCVMATRDMIKSLMPEKEAQDEQA